MILSVRPQFWMYESFAHNKDFELFIVIIIII